MTWAYIGAAAVTVIGGAYNQSQSKKATSKAGKKITDAQAQADALSQQRYLDAKKTLSPYLLSSSVANRQLINEMGLGGQYDAAENKSRVSNLAEMKAALAEMQAAKAQSEIDTKKANKKKNKGGLNGALGKITGSQNINDMLSPIKSAKMGINAWKWSLGHENQMGPDGKPLDLNSSIAELQRQIEETQSSIDQYAANPNPESSKPGTAYMNTPAYQGAIDAGVGAVNQGAANGGGLYSGARGVALRDVGQGVQQSFYTNYMNMLQNMANPATATNLSNIGINQAGNIGQQNIAATSAANGYNLMGTEAGNAANADMVGGLTSAFTAYMNRPQQQKVGVSNPANTSAYNTLPTQSGQV